MAKKVSKAINICNVYFLLSVVRTHHTCNWISRLTKDTTSSKITIDNKSNKLFGSI